MKRHAFLCKSLAGTLLASTLLCIPKVYAIDTDKDSAIKNTNLFENVLIHPSETINDKFLLENTSSEKLTLNELSLVLDKNYLDSLPKDTKNNLLNHLSFSISSKDKVVLSGVLKDYLNKFNKVVSPVTINPNSNEEIDLNFSLHSKGENDLSGLQVPFKISTTYIVGDVTPPGDGNGNTTTNPSKPSDSNNNNSSLPQTGQSLNLEFLLLGIILMGAGSILRVSKK